MAITQDFVYIRDNVSILLKFGRMYNYLRWWNVKFGWVTPRKQTMICKSGIIFRFTKTKVFTVFDNISIMRYYVS